MSNNVMTGQEAYTYGELEIPWLPTEAQAQRADRLIKIAEHPALTPDEQRNLLALAVRDLTGNSFEALESVVE